MFCAVYALRRAILHNDVDPPSLSLNDEFLAHALHLLHILLADRLTHTISFGHGKASQQPRSVHRLLLIENYAVCFSSQLVKYRVK
ncbi:Uncharacterised protein [Klebsiella pneumoniae]|nr:Uncharacterised protein [Klebsiella pneumoniae]